MSKKTKKLNACPKITETLVTDDGKIKISWTEIMSADKYAVKRSDSFDGEFVVIGWTTETEYIDKTVQEDTTYWYQVVAKKKVNGKKNATKRSSVSACVVSKIPAPSGVKAKGAKKAAIKLKWKCPGDISNFIVNRRNNYLPQFAPVAKAEGGSFVDEDIVSGQLYHYRIQSIVGTPDGEKHGNFSKEIHGIHLGKSKILSVKSGTFKKVYISVRIVAGADGYIIERSEDGENYHEVGRTSADVDVRFTDKAEKMFKVYYYRVRAFRMIEDQEFVGEYSDSITVRTR